MADRTCAVNGCQRAPRSNTAEWCNTHYFRWYRTGDVGDPEIWDKKRKPCMADGCDRVADGGLGYCSKHYQRHRSHGDTSMVLTTARERNASWVGDAASYHTMHNRLRSWRGPAKTHACARCSRPAAQWAYDHADPDERQSDLGPYSLSVDHYLPMCVPCHKRFDLGVLAGDASVQLRLIS